MNSYHYSYRRVKNGMLITGSIENTTFDGVVRVLTEISTDTMEIIYIIKVS